MSCPAGLLPITAPDADVELSAEVVEAVAGVLAEILLAAVEAASHTRE